MNRIFEFEHRDHSVAPPRVALFDPSAIVFISDSSEPDPRAIDGWFGEIVFAGSKTITTWATKESWASLVAALINFGNRRNT